MEVFKGKIVNFNLIKFNQNFLKKKKKGSTRQYENDKENNLKKKKKTVRF